MPIKLKVDEKGSAVLKDGMPVCVHEDGTEFVHDIDSAVRKINNFNEERDRHTKRYAELESKFKPYETLDPDEVRDALEIKKNLSEKKLLDLDGVKAIKKEMRTSFDLERDDLVKQHKETIEKIQNERKADQDLIYNLMVSEQFHKSPFFTGDDRKTIYNAQDATKIFGEHFRVERDPDSGKASVKAYLDDKPILSRQNHGEPADFEEAIGILIDRHPFKDAILRGSKGSNHNPGGNTDFRTADRNSLSSTDLIKRGLEKRAAGKA